MQMIDAPVPVSISVPTEPLKFKVVLIGDGGTGKTTFIGRHLSGKFAQQYIPTRGVDKHSLTFDTNYGQISFDLWDTAEQERCNGLGDGYYINSDAAMIFFDTSSRSSYTNSSKWRRDVSIACPNIPIVICGNKVDIVPRIVKHRDIDIGKDGDGECEYYDVSAKSLYNLNQPFLYLAKKLTNHNDLHFISQ